MVEGNEGLYLFASAAFPNVELTILLSIFTCFAYHPTLSSVIFGLAADVALNALLAPSDGKAYGTRRCRGVRMG